jgi:predicted alternative tryptophan synthase beta-subunit
MNKNTPISITVKNSTGKETESKFPKNEMMLAVILHQTLCPTITEVFVGQTGKIPTDILIDCNFGNNFAIFQYFFIKFSNYIGYDNMLVMMPIFFRSN